MYFGDKIALDNLKNHSICVRTDNGIRNIKCEQDISAENLIYVENIEMNSIVVKGNMVRYRPVAIMLR